MKQRVQLFHLLKLQEQVLDMYHHRVSFQQLQALVQQAISHPRVSIQQLQVLAQQDIFQAFPVLEGLSAQQIWQI